MIFIGKWKLSLEIYSTLEIFIRTLTLRILEIFIRETYFYCKFLYCTHKKKTSEKSQLPTLAKTYYNTKKSSTILSNTGFLSLKCFALRNKNDIIKWTDAKHFVMSKKTQKKTSNFMYKIRWKYIYIYELHYVVKFLLHVLFFKILL